MVGPQSLIKFSTKATKATKALRLRESPQTS
jgi:hypothetical protein